MRHLNVMVQCMLIINRTGRCSEPGESTAPALCNALDELPAAPLMPTEQALQQAIKSISKATQAQLDGDAEWCANIVPGLALLWDNLEVRSVLCDVGFNARGFKSIPDMAKLMEQMKFLKAPTILGEAVQIISGAFASEAMGCDWVQDISDKLLPLTLECKPLRLVLSDVAWNHKSFTETPDKVKLLPDISCCKGQTEHMIATGVDKAKASRPKGKLFGAKAALSPMKRDEKLMVLRTLYHTSAEGTTNAFAEYNKRKFDVFVQIVAAPSKAEAHDEGMPKKRPIKLKKRLGKQSTASIFDKRQVMEYSCSQDMLTL